MTDTDRPLNKAGPPRSMNDDLPSGNPSLVVVLAVLVVLGLGALVLTFHASFGF
jgi:hypothetical protein